MSGRFEGNARTVSLLTMASRVTGLARDAVLSRVFGAGPLMDAFFFAFLIPNLFRRLFGEGALSAAFLPVYSQLDGKDPATAKRLAGLTISALMVGLGTLTLIGEAVLFVISSTQGHGNLAVWLTMITLPYMPLVCLVALLGAMLQVHGKFGPPAAAPIILNVCMIATAGGLAPLLDGSIEHQRLIHIGATAGSVVLAGTLQMAWALSALGDKRWWGGAGGLVDLQAAREGFRRVLRQAGPMIVGLGVLQLNTFLDGLIASYPVTVGSTIFGVDYPLSEGAMSTVSFAQRLYQFPLAVFGIAVATAIFPQLAKLSDDKQAFGDVLRRGLRLVVFIGLPASAGLLLVATPLAAVVYQGGQFSAADAERVGFVLLGYAPAIWAYSMVHVLTRAFYAREDAKTPVRVAVGVVALNLTLNLVLIWTPLREAALAWSTAICSIIQALSLLVLARRHSVHLVDGAVRKSWLTSLGLTFVMAGVTWSLSLMMPDDGSWGLSFLTLATLVVVGAVVYGLGARALGRPELRWVIGRSTGD